MKVIYDQNRPIYLQIIERIKREVVNGEIKPGDRILSMSDMSEKMDVNPNTMFRVYKELENQGIIESRRGLGSYLVEDEGVVAKLLEEMAGEILTTAINGLRELNFTDEQIVDAVKSKLKAR